VDDSFADNGRVTLVRLIDALGGWSDWLHLNQMFKTIEEAREARRQITMKKILCLRLNMKGPTFRKFEQRVIDRLRESLSDIFPSEGELLDADLIPTEKGVLVWKVAAWVAQVVTDTYYNIGFCGVNGPDRRDIRSTPVSECK